MTNKILTKHIPPLKIGMRPPDRCAASRSQFNSTSTLNKAWVVFHVRRTARTGLASNPVRRERQGNQLIGAPRDIGQNKPLDNRHVTCQEAVVRVIRWNRPQDG